MNELGYVILKNGEIIPFGEYKCTMYRENDNEKHFHVPAFRSDVLSKRKKDFPFVSEIEKFDILANLQLMSKNGIIVLLNSTEGTFEPSTPIMLLASPDETTLKQKESLISIENVMDYFSSGLSYINIINNEGVVVEETFDLSKFYKDIADYNYEVKVDYNELAKRYVFK